MSNQLLVQVVIDIAGDQLGDKLFTYLVPSHLVADMAVGTQVLVPFGNQEAVNALVVSVIDQASTPDLPKSLKEILDILDNRQLFDDNYLDFLHWIADYYCASLTSVLAAALPANLNFKTKRIVKLTAVDSLDLIKTLNLGEAAAKILEALLKAKDFKIATRTLKVSSSLKTGAFYRGLAELREHDLVKILSQASCPTTAKLSKRIFWTGKEPITVKQKNIVALLKEQSGQVDLSELLKLASTTADTIKRMEKSGIVDVREQEQIRDPLQQYGFINDNLVGFPELTAAQSQVFEVLIQELHSILNRSSEELSEEVKPWLLYGVTGSGKTEIYLRLISETIKLGKSALLLVPEISLTPQLAQRLQERFGCLVSIWHSALSAGERYDTWRRLKTGEIKVLLGARSAVFADIPNLGLIILDEEHDASYKQSSPSPRYNAKHVALEKARRVQAMVVLGSATPDMISLFNSQKHKRILKLPNRIYEQAMPEIKLVDMRLELQKGNYSIFSQILKTEIAACIERQEQAILLINRRGFANHVFCKACGYVAKCKNCSVSLVLHQYRSKDESSSSATSIRTERFKSANHTGTRLLELPVSDTVEQLKCHHCGFTTQYKDTCPSCNSPYLEAYGLGTQRVQNELQELFPTAKILRLDSDVIAKRGAYQAVFRQFVAGEADILVGTQMVAKGLDIPKVTLVGIIAADAAFNLPDYRSTERGFQLLTQVSGRAGRGNKPGVVILQTYSTELPAIKLAQQHNFEQFAESELQSRSELGYPPFTQIIRVVVSGKEVLEVQAACEELAEHLTKYLEDQILPDEITVLGPAPCLLEKVRGSYRYHLLVKNFAGDNGRNLVSSFLRGRRIKGELVMAIDIDAVDLL